jgi:hypothetical protein
MSLVYVSEQIRDSVQGVKNSVEAFGTYQDFVAQKVRIPR